MNAANNSLSGPSPAANDQVSATARTPQTRLASLLDKAIVVLMAAIVLTLALPVGMVLWHQARPAGEPNALLVRVPAPPTPSFAIANRVRTA